MFPTVPPRVEYALTELGRSLKGAGRGAGLWAIDNQPALEAARRRFDARNGTG